MTNLGQATRKTVKAARKPAARAGKRAIVKLRAHPRGVRRETPVGRPAEAWMKGAFGTGRRWAHVAANLGETAALTGIRTLARAGRRVAKPRAMFQARDVTRIETRVSNLVKDAGARTHAWVDAAAQGAELGLIGFGNTLAAEARVAVKRWSVQVRKALADAQARIVVLERGVQARAS